ncbi:MAG TPA: hypothetical protein VK619_06225 [Pyrinomonadaceae bacterium]|nr:hypothetical protein [Pyrinomonadaceae bacterium]
MNAALIKQGRQPGSRVATSACVAHIAERISILAAEVRSNLPDNLNMRVGLSSPQSRFQNSLRAAGKNRAMDFACGAKRRASGGL